MKRALVNTVSDLMREKDNVYMMTADLGYGVMNRIVEEYPDKFINTGICEQNMMSVATGMALEGNIVFTYSIGNFASLRCLEQIRNDVAYHNANVKIIAVGGGFAYGSLGMSHHATEDIAIMRAIPNVIVLSPADSAETEAAVKYAASIDGPVYIRLGRGGEESILHQEIQIEKLMCIAKDDTNEELPSVALLGTGTVMSDVVRAFEELRGSVNISVYSVAQIKPIDVETVLKLARDNDYIVTVEEHNIIGGLAGAVAEILAEHASCAKLIRMGLQDQFTGVVGSNAYLRDCYGLDCQAIVKKVKSLTGK